MPEGSGCRKGAGVFFRIESMMWAVADLIREKNPAPFAWPAPQVWRALALLSQANTYFSQSVSGQKGVQYKPNERGLKLRWYVAVHSVNEPCARLIGMAVDLCNARSRKGCEFIRLPYAMLVHGQAVNLLVWSI
jgi:hypothetical protein